MHWNVVSTLLYLCDTVEQVGHVSCGEVMRVIIQYSQAGSTCGISLQAAPSLVARPTHSVLSQDAMSSQRVAPVVDRIKLLTKLCNLTARQAD